MISSASQLDPRELRNTFGSFGTGVTIVTTRHPHGRMVGVTANSFSSVSLDPPIVLWSLLSTSPSLEAFEQAGRFTINVLSAGQHALCRQFSSRVPDKFAGVSWQEGLGGVPVLDDCAANIECRTIDRRTVGDHELFLGQVENYSYQRIPPLLFCQGNFLQGVALELSAS
jgi:flavin reductase (DIM6/NTAB) family NADH-FMN oxidoreductase RutF